VVKREVAETTAGALYWKYPATGTTEEGLSARAVVVWPLQPAAMENAIKEHKRGFGLATLPPPQFPANWAYLLIGQLAFNLVAWFKRLVLPPSYQRATLKTIRHHLLNLAGKLVHTARRVFWVISDCYRYQAVWQFAMNRLAHVQFG
jgi:hypothetical protein